MQRLEVSCAVRHTHTHTHIYIYVVRRQRVNACLQIMAATLYCRCCDCSNFVGSAKSKDLTMTLYSVTVLLPRLDARRGVLKVWLLYRIRQFVFIQEPRCVRTRAGSL